MRRIRQRIFSAAIAGLTMIAVASAQEIEPSAVGKAQTVIAAKSLDEISPRLAPHRMLDGPQAETATIGVLQSSLAYPEELSAPDKIAPSSGGLSRNFRIELKPMRARAREEGFLSVEESLQSGLAVAAPEKRLDAALLLTTFYMAHGFHVEALALIDETEGAAAQSDLVLLSGIANFYIGRFDDAVTALSHDILLGNEEALAWRGIANALRGAYQAAAQDLFDAQPSAFSFEGAASAFLLAKAETAIALEDYVIARAALKGLQRSPLDNSQRGHRALLEAQLMLVEDRRDPARHVLQQLVRSGPAPFANLAAILLLEDEFNHGTLDPGTVAERTDALMLSWRGGAFERRALAVSAKMHEAAGDIGEAYQLRRQIMDRFSNADDGKVAEQQMRADLATLVERGALSPLDAAQIFYENIDLAPPGREGDMLIRTVADQLLALDLVSLAAELLHHQTFERLRGPDRSRMAGDLAQLYLLDNHPLKALQVLRSTRLARLPDAVNDQRRWLEARALVGAGDTAAALVLLKKDASVESAKIRGEIHWSARQWALAGDAFSAAAALPLKIESQLDREQSILVLRAASAYGLSGEQSKLRDLGRRVSGKLADTDANHLLEGLAFGGLADNPAQFQAAYRAFFGDGATAS